MGYAAKTGSYVLPPADGSAVPLETKAPPAIAPRRRGNIVLDSLTSDSNRNFKADQLAKRVRVLFDFNAEGPGELTSKS